MNCSISTMTLHNEVVAWSQYLSFTKVKRRWVTLVLGWVTTSVHNSCLSDGFVLAKVDQNPFRPCSL